MILSNKHLKLIDEHKNNKTIKLITLILTLLGCLTQIYYHTNEYISKEVLREFSKKPSYEFIMPDLTMCFEFVYLIDLNKLKKIKPIVLSEVEKFFKISLNEINYFYLVKNSNKFKEYYIRKLDEYLNLEEFFYIIYNKSQIFNQIHVSYGDKIGYMTNYQYKQHCLIKQSFFTFFSCFTLSCSKQIINYNFNKKSLILDDEIQTNDDFEGMKIKEQYLISFLGKNIVQHITLNKYLFQKNGLKNFFVQLHKPNTNPRRLKSLFYLLNIDEKGFRQIITYRFLIIHRLKEPYTSNCSNNDKILQKINCENLKFKKKFNSLIFGSFFFKNREDGKLKLGINSLYYFFNYNYKIINKLKNDCLFNYETQNPCHEHVYYIRANPSLPNNNMVIQLMTPMNTNYICQDQPNLLFSEYLLKCLSMTNFWFGFSIVQMLFNIHDDLKLILFRMFVTNYYKHENKIKKNYNFQLSQLLNNLINILNFYEKFKKSKNKIYFDYKLDKNFKILLKDGTLIKLRNYLNRSSNIDINLYKKINQLYFIDNLSKTDNKIIIKEKKSKKYFQNLKRKTISKTKSVLKSKTVFKLKNNFKIFKNIPKIDLSKLSLKSSFKNLLNLIKKIKEKIVNRISDSKINIILVKEKNTFKNKNLKIPVKNYSKNEFNTQEIKFDLKKFNNSPIINSCVT